MTDIRINALAALLNAATQPEVNARTDIFGKDYTAANTEGMPVSWPMYGYPGHLTFKHYYAAYSRISAASAVVRIPVEEAWSQFPRICNDETATDDPLAAEVSALDKRIGLFRAMKGVDERQRVGRYAGLIVIIKDSRKLNTPIGNGEVVELKPLYESQIKPTTWNTDANSVDYGKPTMYQLNENGIGDRDENNGRSCDVHPSRLVIWAEGADDGSIYGRSCLEPVYNSILTLDKIEGAGGTGFFRNARGQQVLKYQASDIQQMMSTMGIKTTDELKDKLKETTDDFAAVKDAIMLLINGERETVSITLPDPEPFARMCWDNIAAGTRYPETIMRGSQTGERASTQDQEQAAKATTGRRRDFLTPAISATINKLIELGALKAGRRNQFEVVWPDAFEPSLEGKLQMMKVAMDGMKGYNPDPVKLAMLCGMTQEQAQAFAVDELPLDDEGENAATNPSAL